MASYTQIHIEEACDILSLYAFKKVKKLTPLSLGISNSNYRVLLADNNEVLLKISNDKNQKQLQDEQEILLYLHEQGYPYSLRPYQTREGKLVYEYKKYFGVVFPFVKGIPPGPSDFTCSEVGRAIATLHSINQNPIKLKSLRHANEVGFGAREIFDYCQLPHCPTDFKEAFYHFFPDNLEKYMGTQFETGIIHGDLYYDNTLFDNNKLASVLDFEQAGIGEYILDLGISISGTCLEKGRLISPLVNSYLQGYESVRPLPQIEKDFINSAILLGLMSISLWRIKRFKEGSLNPIMADSYRDLLTRAYHYFEMCSNNL